MTDDKLSDQYVVQRPSARASRRKDEFIWYDKTSGELRGEKNLLFSDCQWIDLNIQQLFHPQLWKALLPNLHKFEERWQKHKKVFSQVEVLIQLVYSCESNRVQANKKSPSEGHSWSKPTEAHVISI